MPTSSSSDLAVLVTPLVVLLMSGPACSEDEASAARPRKLGLLAFALVCFCAFCLNGVMGWGYVRRSVQIGGPFFKRSVAIHNDAPDFFRGVSYGNVLAGVLADFEAICRRIGTHEKIFIGPRLGFLYPAFRISPPKGMPLWWHEGDEIPPGRTAEFVKKFEAAKFKYLVFFDAVNTDYTYLPNELKQVIFRDYVAEPEGGNSIILMRTEGCLPVRPGRTFQVMAAGIGLREHIQFAEISDVPFLVRPFLDSVSTPHVIAPCHRTARPQ